MRARSTASTSRSAWSWPSGARRYVQRRVSFVGPCFGAHTDLAELGEVPATVEVHRWVPQLSVLARADAFVTHAGPGDSSEVLFHGVPMIAVPQAADQFANADALVGLGVARRLDTEQATPQALRGALLELVGDPAVAERSAVPAAAGRAEGGTARAADLIEAELRR